MKTIEDFKPLGYGLRISAEVDSKFGEDRKKLLISVEMFVHWIANNNLALAAYRAFMSGRLSGIDKQYGVCLVGVGETWRRLFAKCVLKVT